MFSTEKFLEAVKKRESLRIAAAPDRETNAFRLIDSDGDGLPGLIVDDFDGRWLAQTFQASPPKFELPPQYRSLYWKELSKTDKTVTPRYLAGEPVTKPFEILENGLRYAIDFAAGYSQGIFLDQRENRRQLREMANGLRVLNTFSYTCAFGVSAAFGGASTVNVDLSRRYLDWGRNNYERNGIETGSHEFIYGDVFDWLVRFEKKQRLFDVIVLDPPTFSRPRRSSQDFRVKDHYGDLVALAMACLAPHGSLLCTTNLRGINPGKFRGLVAQSVPRRARIIARQMPRDFSGEQYLKSVWVET
jgi:23S rRNA (cytosine1962-C5)-methyltransferase